MVYQKISAPAKESLSMEQNLSDKKILMVIAYRDFRDEEYFVPREILQRPSVVRQPADEGGEKESMEIKVASSEKGMALGVSGGEVDVDLELAEVNVDEFDAIVFVGGPGAHNYIENSECHRIAKQAVEKNKVLGAICIAPAILAKAGVLSGKKATVWSSIMDKSAVKILEDNGAKYQGDNIVIDGKIITANGPAAAEEFGQAIVKELAL